MGAICGEKNFFSTIFNAILTLFFLQIFNPGRLDAGMGGWGLIWCRFYFASKLILPGCSLCLYFWNLVFGRCGFCFCLWDAMAPSLFLKTTVSEGKKLMLVELLKFYFDFFRELQRNVDWKLRWILPKI